MELRGKNKIIVILGPTSSGKSGVAISLARKFNGEIISADSRQIYRGMNIGTGKVPRDKKQETRNKDLFFSEGVRHHLLDIVNPKTDFNVSKFKLKAEKAIEDILKRGKVPIICGGTGFWIKALVDDVTFPEVKPNQELRRKLEVLSTENLFKKLLKLDSERAKNIDAKNKVRLIRAIEICKAIGKVPTMKHKTCNMQHNFLQIGLDLPKEKLHKNIEQRLKTRFKKGMIREVENLHFQSGVSWKRLEMFGLEYRYISQYLQGKFSKEEIYPVKFREADAKAFNRMKEKLFQESKDYAKRQMTWFRKDSRILWLKNYSAIEKATQKFLH